MPIEAYLPTSGASFGPDAVTNMGKPLRMRQTSSGLGRATKPNAKLSLGSLSNLPKSTGAWMRRACAIRPLWL